MVSKFKQMSLASQLSAVISLLLLVTGFAMTIALTSQTKNDLAEEAEQSLNRQTEVITRLVEFYYQDSLNNAQRLSDIFFNMFPQSVEFDAGKQVQVAHYQTQALRDEAGIVNGDFTKPDQFTRMTGGTATVFARHGNDFLRISTSLKKQNGDRAFGTLLGTGHPGYQRLMRGETYTGVAHLFGRDYMTVYRPVRSNGDTIAVLYIGFDLTKGLQALREAITSIKVGQTGYATVIGGPQHKRAGQVLMHPTLEGEQLTTVTTPDGLQPFQELLQNAEGSINYLWAGEGSKPAEKMLSYRQIDGWNWVLALGTYTEEFAQTSHALRNTMVVMMLISVVITIVGASILMFRMLSPLKHLTRSLQEIGAGQLNTTLKPVEVGADCKNEISHLRQGVIHMRDNLHGLVSQLQEASVSLKDSVVQVRGASESTESAVNQQSLETNQVVSAMEEMASTTHDVAESVRNAAEQTQYGAEKASEGKQVMVRINQQINTLTKEMEGASELVSQVELESENISNFVDTISQVAEQTNLLALNAAIEAARAGESGRGFAVVADEVRALAGRTQQATSQIESIVGRLQTNIHQVVEVIGEGNTATRQSADQAEQARVMLDTITDYMESITDTTTSIASAAEQQAAVAETVSQSLHRIHDLSEDTRAQSNATLHASQSLDQVSHNIEGKLSQFSV